MGETVTIPIEEYKALQVAAQELADLRAYDRTMDALACGEEEQVPAEIARRMVAGESPLRVWREFRGLTQQALAGASGVNRVQITDIESGKGSGSVATLVKLASALNVTVDDLI